MAVTFETDLRDALQGVGADLPDALWTYIRWLEAEGQVYTYRATNQRFLATMPVAGIDALFSHLAFELPPDLVRYWLGKEGFERQIIPLAKCGGDGSYIALWKHDDQPDQFVFLGSEGESFVITENPVDLIAILTMGYSSIEGRDVLAATPAEAWAETDEEPWLEPVTAKDWATQTFGNIYMSTGAEYLPHATVADPFDQFIKQIQR